jgi:hypothetical protein
MLKLKTSLEKKKENKIKTSPHIVFNFSAKEKPI